MILLLLANLQSRENRNNVERRKSATKRKENVISLSVRRRVREKTKEARAAAAAAALLRGTESLNTVNGEE